MKLDIGRARSHQGLARCAALLVLSCVACRETKKEESSSVADASVSAPTAAAEAPAASGVASTSAAAAVVPELVALGDAGTDGGRPRKLRRLTAGASSAGSPEVAGAVAPPEPVVAADPRRPNPRTPTAMADDLPYGGAAGSGAAVLKKTPLPTEDPWAR